MAGVTPRFARLSDDELAELEHEIVKPCRVFEYFMDLNVFLGGKSKNADKNINSFFLYEKTKLTTSVMLMSLARCYLSSAMPRLRLGSASDR